MAFNFFRKGSMKGADGKFSKTALLTGGWDIPKITRSLVRCVLFIFGIAVIGLYAQDLVRAHKAGVAYDPKWSYATATGTIACIWAFICLVLGLKAWYWFFFPADYIVAFLYMVATGIFGKMYVKEDPEGDSGIVRMKHAVWVLLANMIMWLLAGFYGTFVWWKSNKAKKAQASPSDIPQVSQV